MSTPSLVTFLSWPRHPVSVQDALTEVQVCPVMTRLDVEKMLLLASNKVGVLEERMRKRMATVQMVKKCGLVHWSGEEKSKSCDWLQLIPGRVKAKVGGDKGKSGHGRIEAIFASGYLTQLVKLFMLLFGNFIKF